MPRMKILELLCLAPMFKAWTSEKKGSYGSEQVVSSPCGEDGTTLVQSKPGAGVEMPPPWVWKWAGVAKNMLSHQKSRIMRRHHDLDPIIFVTSSLNQTLLLHPCCLFTSYCFNLLDSLLLFGFDRHFPLLDSSC